MRARAVIGANFGDEGKGLVVDYLCSMGGVDAVVRFNGGAQAGHTVVTPQLKRSVPVSRRHVFSHFGSGSFLDVPTFLSEHFVCNPALFVSEYKELLKIGVKPVVFVDPDCLVTTPTDMLINQELERRRGVNRHGSCGVGFAETITRNQRFQFTMRDVLEMNSMRLGKITAAIDVIYANERLGAPLKVDTKAINRRFFEDCFLMSRVVHAADMKDFIGKNLVFEGAQGLLLDQHRMEYFPHLTRSNTGMKNVWALCREIGIEEVDAYYVTRTYLTRHGAGPMPNEWVEGHPLHGSLTCKTNVMHPWQGQLRYGTLDLGLKDRCFRDYLSMSMTPKKATGVKFAITHCDQIKPTMKADLYSYGETREDVARSVRPEHSTSTAEVAHVQ